MARSSNGCGGGCSCQNPGCAAGDALQTHQHPQLVLPHVLHNPDQANAQVSCKAQAPDTLLGMLPHRSAQQVWYAMQLQVETTRMHGVSLCGVRPICTRLPTSYLGCRSLQVRSSLAFPFA